MKKVLPLLLTVALFSSCHKRQYAAFNYQKQVPYLQQKKNAPASTPEALSALVGTDIASLTLGEPKATFAQPGIADKVPEAAKVQPTAAGKATLKIKRANRRYTKAVEPRMPRTSKAVKTGEKLGITSVILSAAGLVTGILALTIPGPLIMFILGVGAAVTGTVLGIVALSRIKKNLISISNKGPAIVGVVLGGLATLLGIFILLVIAAISSTFGR